jgi:tRNA-splicing ligase RtcB
MRMTQIGPDVRPGEEERNAPLVFDSDEAPAEPAVLAEFARGVRHADLAARPVVLPDFHHKSDMEMPSSIAVATLDTIRPVFTSSSVNCGMALLAMDLEPPAPADIERFFRRVRDRFPYPPTRRRDLTVDEVVRAAVEGGAFAVDRYGLPADELERVEHDGRLDVDEHGGADAIRRRLPNMTWQLSRMRFGTIGPSNHFIEMQAVEEILDPHAAAVLGVREGQVTVQYHGGGGVLASQVGRLFGRRTKMSRQHQLIMGLQKPPFHLLSARSLAELKLRRALYFSGDCPPVPRHSAEGERFMLANAVAMNYGFAFRLATYAEIRRIADEMFGDTASRLIVDSPHNSIYEEEVGGESAVVHRHNSCRAFPASGMRPGTAFGEVGQALLVPGTSRTSSYLCVADEGAAASLHSACHGTGTMIDRAHDLGISREHPAGHRTLRFRYSDADPTEVPHLDDRGINQGLDILVRHRLVRPVARMRPMGVLN